MALIRLISSPIIDSITYKDSRGADVTTYSVAPFQNVIDPETIEARNVADISAALDSYAARAAATGKPGEATAIFPRQSARKPSGFDAAKHSGKLARLFNEGAAR